MSEPDTLGGYMSWSSQMDKNNQIGLRVESRID